MFNIANKEQTNKQIDICQNISLNFFFMMFNIAKREQANKQMDIYQNISYLMFNVKKRIN